MELDIKKRINSILASQSTIFILVNVVVAFLGFVRSFAFVRIFDFKDLGLVTLVSTGAMLIGFLQFGLLNGGYRIVSLNKPELSLKVNNVVFTYLTCLFLFLMAVFAVGQALGLSIDPSIFFLSILIGVSTLVFNWLTNILIGHRKYKILNSANLVGSISSLACIFLGFYYGLIGAIITLLAHPVLFVIAAFLQDKTLFPTRFDLDIKHIKKIFRFGFVLYLSGLFFLIFIQIERWSVTSLLGAEALGKLYLVSLIISLWSLIPTSVNNILFPRAVQFYSDLDFKSLISTVKTYFFILGVYSFFGCLLIYTLLPSFVQIVFSKHGPFTYLVLLALPGIVIKALADPLTLFLYSVAKVRPIFWSDLISLTTYALLLIALMYFEKFSLEMIVVSFDVYCSVKFVFLLFAYCQVKRKISI